MRPSPVDCAALSRSKPGDPGLLQANLDVKPGVDFKEEGPCCPWVRLRARNAKKWPGIPLSMDVLGQVRYRPKLVTPMAADEGPSSIFQNPCGPRPAYLFPVQGFTPKWSTELKIAPKNRQGRSKDHTSWKHEVRMPTRTILAKQPLVAHTLRPGPFRG